MKYTEADRERFIDEILSVVLSALDHLPDEDVYPIATSHQNYVDMLFAKCSEEERVAFLVSKLVETTNNSGLAGWLTGGCGRLVEETLDALQLIGANQYKQLLLEFGEVVKSLGQPFNDQADWHVLDQSYEAKLRDLEERFGDLHYSPEECLYTRLAEWRAQRSGTGSDIGSAPADHSRDDGA